MVKTASEPIHWPYNFQDGRQFSQVLFTKVKQIAVITVWVWGWMFVRKNNFDLIKTGATQTETLLLKQYVACECVHLLDEYFFIANM